MTSVDLRRGGDAFAALAIGILAAAVSAIASGVPSFWLDEAASLSASDRPLPDLMGLLGRLDAVHGAYYVLLHGWTSVAGGSAVAVRMPSALAVGVATAGTFVLARQLIGRRDVAWVAAIVFMMLPRVTWMGIEARSFAFATAGAVWLTVVYLWAARGPGRRWWVYLALAALGIVLHLYVALLLIVHAIGVRWFVPTVRGRWQWAAASAGGVALASPVVLLALGQRGQLTDTELAAAGLLRRIIVNQWFLGETPQGVGAVPWQPAAIGLSLIGWLLVTVGVVRLARSPERGKPLATAVLLGSWVVVPTAVVAADSLLGGSLYHPRYFGFCAPAVSVLLGFGLMGVRRPAARLMIAAVMLALVLPVYASQRGINAKSGYDWSTVVQRLDREAAEGDGVYFSPLRPDDADEVRATMRPIASAYPATFADLVDVTRIDGPEQRHRLFAGSRQLAASGPELDQLSTVWVIRRSDLAASVRAQEDSVLGGHGFAPVSSWSGPRTSVVRFERS